MTRVQPRPIAKTEPHGTAFTFATLVTDRDQYDAMIASFEAAGFGPGDCEFIYIDNTDRSQAGAQTGAYEGLNRLLNAAVGAYVVLCHQDVRAIDPRQALEARLRELDQCDPAWGLAGNAGATTPGRLALRISDPHGADRRLGPFPARVMSLDENFIVARRDARIGLSHDLEGFHLYGADMCLQADVRGYRSYVIDYHLEHLSPGRKDATFTAMEQTFRTKWSRALRPRWLQTTCTLLRLSGTPHVPVLRRIVERAYSKIVRRRPGATGWTRQSAR